MLAAALRTVMPHVKERHHEQARVTLKREEIVEDEPVAWGPNKRPVAAGRGSGGLAFDIAPGAPDRSILVYRMEALEPDIMMPELGRTIPHPEGIALIREWIAAMEN